MRNIFRFLAILVLCTHCDDGVKVQNNCGDEFIDPGEQCDGSNLQGQTCTSLGYYNTTGVLVCNSVCEYDLSDCGGTCGDGVFEEPEECDGLSMQGNTCATFGYTAGSLSCTEGCELDLSGCTSQCGNGILETGEACDDGDTEPDDGCDAQCTVEAGWSCDDTSPSVCVFSCGDGVVAGSETCDGTNFEGKTCLTESFYGGEMACTDTCAIDDSACVATGRCGDDLIQAAFGEDCDGTTLGGATCASLGYTSGELACDAACVFDLTACVSECGNGQLEVGEDCDDGNAMPGDGCDLCAVETGWDCTAASPSVCTPTCGDGVILGDEECDGADLNSQTCNTRGFPGGSITCDGACRFDFSTCNRWTQVEVGDEHTCAITDAGALYCWGNNGTGALGDGTNTSRPLPTPVSGMTSGVIKVALGGYHTCAIKSGGTLWCWGNNLYGQLGLGDTTSRNSPQQVSGVTASDVACAPYHTCAVRTNGSVSCWGYNQQGMLGDGTTTQRTSPITITSFTGVSKVSLGIYHSCALKTNGSAWCWGSNGTGSLGDGTTTNRLTPVAVSGMTTAAMLMVGWNHSCAVKTDGSAWCWGYNNMGQLGTNNTTTYTTPYAVSGLGAGTTAAIDGGDSASCAVETDGSAWCWGQNTEGRLGDGTTTLRSVPTAVAAPMTSGVSQIAIGEIHACALQTNGSLWCWGSNGWSMLGDGTAVSQQLSPVPVVFP